MGFKGDQSPDSILSCCREIWSGREAAAMKYSRQARVKPNSWGQFMDALKPFDVGSREQSVFGAGFLQGQDEGAF